MRCAELRFSFFALLWCLVSLIWSKWQISTTCIHLTQVTLFSGWILYHVLWLNRYCAYTRLWNIFELKLNSMKTHWHDKFHCFQYYLQMRQLLPWRLGVPRTADTVQKTALEIYGRFSESCMRAHVDRMAAEKRDHYIQALHPTYTYRCWLRYTWDM